MLDSFFGGQPRRWHTPPALPAEIGINTQGGALSSRLVMAARHRREAHHINFHSPCRRIHLEKASLFRRPEEKFKLTRSFTAR